MIFFETKYKDYYSHIIERYGGSKLSRGIWYHGTSVKYLKSILSNGLIIDPKEKSWDVDPYASIYQKDRSSYGGIYVTKNLMTAISSAGRTSSKTDHKSNLIVIMELQERSLISDEDSIWLPSIKEHLVLDLYAALLYSSDKNSKYYKWAIKTKNEWIKECIQRLSQRYELNKHVKRRMIAILNSGFRSYVIRQIAYLKYEAGIQFKYDFKRALDGANYKEFHDKSKEDIQSIIDEIPSKSEGEKMYRQVIDSLTKIILPSRMQDKDWDISRITARLMQPIRFSGKNKIISIVELIRNPTRVKVIYGKLPNDFIKQYKERVTPNIVIV